ncbi:MAG TPA: RsmE family RNA methyltransferase [Candidatus Paceibacterota bacterium]|nr:RsmE family RNA methyltransferase [Candidatus Paceibacterota bacterium]
MKIHRFIGGFSLRPGRLDISEEEISHQIWNVLKLRPGEHVMLCDGEGSEAEGVLLERNGSGASVELGSVTQNKNEPANKVSLYCAILKKENFELVCQKATETGVAEIIPVITERTVKLNFRADRGEKIIREAAEQCGRGRLPALLEPMGFEEALERSRSAQRRVMMDATGSAGTAEPAQTAAIFIGPEGGWTEAELALASSAGLKTVSLGSRTLRAETAAIIAVYLAAN